MWILFVRRLSAVAALGVFLQLTLSASADEFAGGGPSAFQNVGYTLSQGEVGAPSAMQPLGVSGQIVHSSDGLSHAGVQQPAAVYYAPSQPTALQPCQRTCCCTQCTDEKKAALKKKAGSAHKPLHYLNDFSYLNDPCYDGCLLGDNLKRMGGNGLTLDLGGQYRARVHREEGFRGLGITGGNDDFLLQRLRLYANLEVGDNIRVFGEMLHADSSYESLGIRPIEENHYELQNAFVDLKLIDNGDSKLVARAGRQEIALGGQRYVSPLDWANTRRTFDGGRIMYSNDTWNVDGFWLAPMVRDFDSIDDANEDQALYGVHATTNAPQNGTLDLYWLAFDDDAAGFGFDSVGARYNGKLGGLLFEAEGAYQFGNNTDGSDHSAGFFTAGLGKAFTEHSCKPTSWVYFDWASGDDDQGAGNGHHHFLPLAHKYNGFMDLFGRRNLIDFNVLSTMQLSPKVKLLMWYHNFWLQNENDTPYFVNMAPTQPGVTPADSHLGHEIDTVLSFKINPRSNILFGYSHFFAGDYYDSPGLQTRFGTPLTQDGADADFFYSQYTLNF